MKRSKRIGLTGSIATGKSEASAFLRSLGYPVIDADQIARQVVEPGTAGLEKIREIFGDTILTCDGTLNRTKLGELIFHDEAKRQQLNAALHPLVIDEMVHRGQQYKSPLLFFDVPLLIETKLYEKNSPLALDEVWLIATNPKVQLQRLMKRDKIPLDYAKQKIASQMSVADKLVFADRIFDNSGDVEHLHHILQHACRQLERMGE